MTSQAIDEYVTTKLPPHQQDIVNALRELVAECAPHAAEVIHYGSPARKGTGVFAIISPSKTHITLAFSRGAEFDDPAGKLTGSGKRTRHAKIKTLDGLDRDVVSDYIGQAVKLDSE